MTQRRWNLLTAVSLAAILAGFLLVRSGLSWGKAWAVLPLWPVSWAAADTAAGSGASRHWIRSTAPTAAPWPPPRTFPTSKGKSLNSFA